MAAGGYAWWYLDAMSDCGEHALSVIAFVGSVFSPFYAGARRRGSGQAEPQAHCALNVALYRRAGGGAWALTEHRRADVRRSASEFALGASRMAWQGHALQVELDERTAPLRRPLRGRLQLRAPALVDRRYALDAAGRHHWHPIAPCARIEVAFSRPALRWQGSAYLDSNTGSRPMEDDFVHWDWLRAPLPDGRTAVLYDGLRRDGTPFSIAQAFDPEGRAADFALAPPAAPSIALPASR
ncbi:MAG: hypothetical protein KGL50_00005, partial [Burkholderiales bacterium]|nr:hypothetical protein [Burkholderiales bacterium]